MPDPACDPVELARLQAVAAAPANTPLHRTEVRLETRPFNPTTLRQLTPEYEWFVLGLATSLLRLDISLTELYSHALDATLNTVDVETDQPLYAVPGIDVSKNPVTHQLVGLPVSRGLQFRAFIESYIFRRDNPEQAWQLVFQEHRIRDPFQQSVGANVFYALPVDTLHRRRIALPPQSFALTTPMVEVVKL